MSHADVQRPRKEKVYKIVLIKQEKPSKNNDKHQITNNQANQIDRIKVLGIFTIKP